LLVLFDNYGNARRQISSVKTCAQIRRGNAPCDARSAAAKRQKGEEEGYLRQAFGIDPNWRKAALEDEDLKPLWDSL
jgi:hypothetical protein